MFETYINITVLAVLQGIAEFLPVSSSGHLVLAQNFLGCNAPGITLDLSLHFGTLISIFIFYRNVVMRIIREFDFVYVIKIVLSAIPSVVVYFVARPVLEGFESTRMVAFLLIVTGLILLSTRFLPKGEKDVSFLRALFMGIGQAFALLPGISRSGMTLVCARFVRVDSAKSAEFSFLMSAPLILGGMLLEILRWDSSVGAVANEGAKTDVSLAALCYGIVLASVVGYVSLAILVKTLKGRHFWLFGLYCLCIGLFTLILI